MIIPVDPFFVLVLAFCGITTTRVGFQLVDQLSDEGKSSGELTKTALLALFAIACGASVLGVVAGNVLAWGTRP